MFYENEYSLKCAGFKKLRGFSRYMIKGSIIYNVAQMRRMTTRKDGRINLTKDDKKRTCVNIKNLK